MSDSKEETLGREASYRSHDRNNDHSSSPQWEAMVRAWLSTLPQGQTLTMSEVEAWISSNQADLSEELKSLPSSQLYDRIALIKNSSQEMGGNLADIPHGKFQRTDQWRPVYSWLESLNTDEVVNSKDISDWLSDNPKVKEDLLLKHSRYHLMHYIKKCHVKILKRKEKMGLRPSSKATAAKVRKSGVAKPPFILQCNGANNYTKDSDLYMAKRSEAFQKYEILVELEKQLSTIFPKQ